jgi:alkanesulfonate monooxygenase SsuD/methylene tetrahydromethanopterin reductase-like flavin-dependent oxidoreductase (luciferase family)
VFVSAVNAYNCRVAGEVCDGISLHPLTSPDFINRKVLPPIADGANRAAREPQAVNLSGSGFIITGPNKSVIEERKYPVRRQIAFYASTRTYNTVLETHGIEDVGVRLHEMSLKGQWEEMTNLITDDILDKFAVAVEYDQVAAAVKDRFDGLLDEVVFGMDVANSDDEQQLRKIVAQLQE